MRVAFAVDACWQKYVRALWLEKAAIFTALASAIGKSLAATGFALALRRLLQAVTEHHHAVLPAIFAASAMALLAAALGLSNRYSVINLVQAIVHDLRQKIVAKLMVLGPGTVGRFGRADLLDMAVHDTERVDRMTASLVGSIIPSLFLVLSYAVALLIIAPRFGAAALGIGTVFWLCSQFLHGSISVHANRYMAAFAGLNRGVLLTLERLGIIRAGGLAKVEMAERQADLHRLRETAISTDQAIGTISEAAALMGNLGIVGLICAAAAVSGPGIMLVDVMTGYLLLLMIRSQVAGTGATIPDLKIGITAFSRIQRLLDGADERPYGGSKTIAFKGHIELRDVSFSFRDEPMLVGLNLTVTPGSISVITGPNGGGKTTLINLVLGIYRPQDGVLLADGVPYDELDIPDLLAGVGYVPQEPMVFADTIARNISYGQPGATLQQVEHAAQLAGAHDFIADLPDGYSTLVGDQGAFLSVGQKQRIALARALLGHHSLLILDEPTNHLDRAAVSALLKTLAGREDTPGVLIITHDLALLESADRVFHLQNGALLDTDRIVPFEPAFAYPP